MSAQVLTRPEGYCEKADRRRVKRLIDASGGCAFCIHRDPLWDRFGCTKSMTYPACLETDPPAFKQDAEKVQGAINAG